MPRHKFSRSIKTNVARRRHVPRSKYRRLGYVMAVMTTALVIPLAVQALSQDPTSQKERQPHNSPVVSDRLPSQSEPDKVKNQTDENEGGQTVDSNIKVESQTNSNSIKGTDVDVSVNGQKVPVPENGIVHKSITSNNGQTTIDIHVDNKSNSSSSSSSSVVVEQHSYSSGDTAQSEGGISSRHPARR